MIKFMWKDFEEADAKTDELYRELLAAQRHCQELEDKIKIAEEERNFIGGWLKRNGAPESVKEEIGF